MASSWAQLVRDAAARRDRTTAVDADDLEELAVVEEMVRAGSSTVIALEPDEHPEVSDSDVDADNHDDDGGMEAVGRLKSVESVGGGGNNDEEWKLLGICQRRRVKGSNPSAAPRDPDDDSMEDAWEYRCYWERFPTSTWERRRFLKDLGYSAELAVFDNVKKDQLANLEARLKAMKERHIAKEKQKEAVRIAEAPRRSRRLVVPGAAPAPVTTPPPPSAPSSVTTPPPPPASTARPWFAPRVPPPAPVRTHAPFPRAHAPVTQQELSKMHVNDGLRQLAYAFMALADRTHTPTSCPLPMMTGSLHHLLGDSVLSHGTWRAAFSGDSQNRFEVFIWRKLTPQKCASMSLGDLPIQGLAWYNPRLPRVLASLHHRAEVEYAESKQRLRFPPIPATADDMWLALTVGRYPPYTTLLLSTEGRDI